MWYMSIIAAAFAYSKLQMDVRNLHACHLTGRENVTYAAVLTANIYWYGVGTLLAF